jgi:hypothetical protein
MLKISIVKKIIPFLDPPQAERGLMGGRRNFPRLSP